MNTAEVDEAAAEAECSACGGEWLEAPAENGRMFDGGDHGGVDGGEG